MASGCSVQSGSKSISSGTTSGTVSISTITTTKSFLVFTVKQADTSGGNVQGSLNVEGYFSSTTQITFERSASASAIVIEWFVVSFSSGVTVQHGYVDNVAGSDVDVTITAVTVSKAFAIVSSRGHFDYMLNRENDLTAHITSTTNLRLRTGSPSSPWANRCRWQVIEYDNASVQLAEDNFTSGTTEETAITTVDTTKTFIAPTSRDNSKHESGCWQWNAYLESDKVKYVRSLEPGFPVEITSYYKTYVVSVSDAIKVTRFQTVLSSSETSKDVTVDIADTSKAFIFGSSQWFKSIGKTDDYSDPYSRACALKINSTTQVNVSRHATGSDEITVYWELIEFERSSAKPQFHHHYVMQGTH